MARRGEKSSEEKRAEKGREQEMERGRKQQFAGSGSIMRLIWDTQQAQKLLWINFRVMWKDTGRCYKQQEVARTR